MNHRIKPTRATTSSKFRRFVVLVLVLVALMAVGFIATRERGPAEAAVDTSSRTDSGPDRLGAPERTNAADKELRTLTVSVVDESEQPVQGARVCLLVVGRAVSAQSCALTDSSGSVDDFELPNGERWRVSTSAEGFRPSIVPRPGELRPSGARVRVTLRRGGVRLTGIVEDATGGTIEGALVSVEDAIGLGVAAARSGEAGEFELWASSGHVVVNATADGYVAAQEHLVLPSGPVRLVLLPESVISGRVLEANSGEPIADAIVIGRSTADDGRTRLDNATFSTQSGEDGRYELRGLSAGVFGLSSRGPQGFGTSEGGVVVEFGSQVEDVDILVHRGTRLRVRVVVTATKQGCPGALVSLLEENTGHGLTATTDQDGRVELSVPVAGDYRADVTCTGQRVVGEAPIIELSGDPNDSETLEIAVESGLLSQGIVVSATDGTPVAEAVVALIPLHGRAPAAVAVADPEGRVELSGLDAGEYVATGSAPGWFPGDSTVTVSVPSDASFELGLHAGGSLTGSVLESDGTPVPSARVLAHRRSVNGRWRGETLVDGQGRYEFSALPPGTYEIDVRSEGGQPLSTPGGSASSATVSIDGGVFAEQHFIVAAQDGTIAGTVVDGEGSPITTAFVCAEPDQPPRDAVARGQCSPRMTDIDGHFLIRGLSQGQFTLTGRVRGGGEASLAGVAPGDDVKLIVQATGSLRGGAHFRSDGSVPDFLVVEVVREDAAIRRREVFLRTRGRWSLAGLPFGDYHVRIKASRGAGAAKIEIGEGVTNAGDIGLDTSRACRAV